MQQEAQARSAAAAAESEPAVAEAPVLEEVPAASDNGSADNGSAEGAAVVAETPHEEEGAETMEPSGEDAESEAVGEVEADVTLEAEASTREE
jgi:hypothetical protein